MIVVFASLLFVNIYHQIKKLILSAALKTGDKLPSSCMLARNFHVSRNVV
ncbi:GntR family transcriptional regulator [Megasphaera paucivorans]